MAVSKIVRPLANLDKYIILNTDSIEQGMIIINDGGSIRYTISGGMCFLRVYRMRFTEAFKTAGYDATILNDLPKPLGEISTMVLFWYPGIRENGTGCVPFTVDNQGRLKSNGTSDIKTDVDISFGVSYPVRANWQP